MARHVVKQRADSSEASSESVVDQPTMPGGASGMPVDPNPQSTIFHGIDDIAPARSVDDPERNRLPKQYRVVGGPEQVMYDGQKIRMIAGKIYSENAVDLDLLRRQGVQLEEIKQEVAA